MRPIILAAGGGKAAGDAGCTGGDVPEACEFEMLALLLKPSPNRQPWQFCMPEPGELPPTKPPAVLLSPVVTAPVADDDVIVPSLLSREAARGEPHRAGVADETGGR